MKRGSMLRSFFISLSKAAWAQRLITSWKFAWRAASRFVAGESIQDAVLVVKELNAKGMNVTLDHLGEATSTREDALQATEDILELLDQIERSKIRANVSVKLTQIGLALDEKLCIQNLEQILKRANQYGNFVRVDMEDTPFTDRTIQLYQQMLAKGFNHTGLVIQSYLIRSAKDIQELLEAKTPIRLVKGAYDEPPELAFPRKADVDSNYDLLTEDLIDAAIAVGSPNLSVDGRIPPIPALGTHDQKRIQFAKDYAARLGMPKQAIEFQMLYGIRRDLQTQCISEGYPVRIYVPYGTHWYQYFMRRLAERPANIWFFVSNYFKK
jgi:proline dehydrogenase